MGDGMEYCILGKSGLKVSKLGIGCEWLHNQPQNIVKIIIQKAIKEGINYFDLVYNFEEDLNYFHNAFKAFKREDYIITHHLGSGEHITEKGKKYQKTRSNNKVRDYLNRYLNILDTDYADIGMVHFVINEGQYEQVVKENGIFDLANQLKNEGKIRNIGMSTHDSNVVIRAVEEKRVDLVMFQVNMANNAMENRNRALSICEQNGVGVVAMKPYGGGRLLMQGSVSFAKYHLGGKGLKKKITNSISTVQCLHYVLSQPGLNIVLPGVKNMEELNGVLAYVKASPEEKDYSGVLKSFDEYREGECVFCDHCSPCPQGIDIGDVFRHYHSAMVSGVAYVESVYNKISVHASNCTECGACEPRCPFNVKIISQMKHTARLFGK